MILDSAHRWPEIFAPGPDLARFSGDRALASCEMSYLTYTPDAEVKGEAEIAGASCEIVTAGSARAVLVDSGTVAWVAITGSNDRVDWRLNLRIWRRRSSIPELAWCGPVHAGFLEDAERLWTAISAWLVSHSRGRVIVTTGHSRGGPLAALVAMAVVASGIRVVGGGVTCYTWSSPRWSSKPGAGLWMERVQPLCPTWRIVPVSDVGTADLVTRLPRRALGYSHVGSPVILEGNQVHESVEAWRRLRSLMGPVSSLTEWRLLSRLGYAAGSHSLFHAHGLLRAITRGAR